MDTKLVVESSGMTIHVGETEVLITHNLTGKSVRVKSSARHIILLPHGETYRIIPFRENISDGGMTF